MPLRRKMMINIMTMPTTTQVLLVGRTKPSFPNIPLSRFFNRSITTVMTTTPTTAPERLCIPPITNIARVMRVRFRKKVSTVSIPRKWPNSPPAMPQKKPLMTKASRRWPKTFTPAALAATSSSREARSARPNLERE